MPPPRVKICGVTSVDDAVACADAGADAVGLNFWPGSKRRCELGVAERIARAVGDRARIVAVDRKSTRLNSSHVKSSYAVFCLKKKNIKYQIGPFRHKYLHILLNGIQQ